MTPTPLVLSIGTEVALTKYASETWSGWIETNEALIVTACSITQGAVNYAVNGCAWFDRRDLLWIADPSPRTLKFVFRIENKDEDEDDEYEVKDLKRHKNAVEAMKGLKLKSKFGVK